MSGVEEGMSGLLDTLPPSSSSSKAFNATRRKCPPIGDALESHRESILLLRFQSRCAVSLHGAPEGISDPRYLEELTKEIQAAYLESYADYGQELFDRYVAFADFWIQEEVYVDPATGVAFDKATFNAELEKLEKPAGIGNQGLPARESFHVLRAQNKNGGDKLVWTSYQKLREVIEKRMFAATTICSRGFYFAKATRRMRRSTGLHRAMMSRGHTPTQVRRKIEWWVHGPAAVGGKPLTSVIVDRRTQKGKSTANRQRLLKRLDGALKAQLGKMIARHKLQDAAQPAEVTIERKDAHGTRLILDPATGSTGIIIPYDKYRSAIKSQ